MVHNRPWRRQPRRSVAGSPLELLLFFYKNTYNDLVGMVFRGVLPLTQH